MINDAVCRPGGPAYGSHTAALSQAPKAPESGGVPLNGNTVRWRRADQGRGPGGARAGIVYLIEYRSLSMAL